MTRQERIAAVLNGVFAPASLDVTDESYLHEGHAGSRPGGETHFRVKIRAAAFAAKTRIARHRLVMDALAAEFAGGLHALAIDAKAPDEA